MVDFAHEIKVGLIAGLHDLIDTGAIKSIEELPKHFTKEELKIIFDYLANKMW